MKKRMVFKRALAGVAIAAFVFGCATPGKPGKARENWNPDKIGNIEITNTSGKDANIYLNDVYVRTVAKGKSAFLINVTEAQNPQGEEYMLKAYDKATSGNINSPVEEALFNIFPLALFPSNDVDQRNPVYLMPSEYRDKEAIAAGRPQVLVKFEYPLEDIALGTVRATVFEGQITSRRNLVVMRPQMKPVMVPMDTGAKQLSVLYTVATNKRVQQFYWPEWTTDGRAVDSTIKSFSVNNLNPLYRISPVSEIATVTWTYPKDSNGQIIVRNKSTRPVELNAASLEPGGKPGLLEQVAVQAAPGSSSMEVGPLSALFTMSPGRYQLSAQAALRNTILSATEVDIEAGTKYYWIITDGESTVEADKSINISTNLNRLIQNWKITSNQSGAKVTLDVESSDAAIPNYRGHELGNTDNSGTLVGSFSIANLIQNLTYGNADKVLLKITVSKAGYVSVSQLFNVLSLLQANDVTPVKFDLPSNANAEKHTLGDEYTISGVPFYNGPSN